MSIVTLQKTEYLSLKNRAEAFDTIVATINPEFLWVPREKSTKKVISEMSKTKLYNKKFLTSLEKGLKRSSFFTA
jgi:hypothetical protein